MLVNSSAVLNFVYSKLLKNSSTSDSNFIIKLCLTFIN